MSPARGEGARLRARREAAGWAADRVAVALHLPVETVHALEADEGRRLPSGPYFEGHLRAYRALLDRVERGLDPEASSASWPAPSRALPTPSGDDGPPSETVIRVAEAPPHEEPRVNLHRLRRMAWAATAVAAVLIGVQAWRVGQQIAARPPADDGFLDVVVELRRTSRMRVEVDGRLAAHREFAGGERLRWRGTREVRFDLPNTNDVAFVVDGVPVSPRGLRSAPRRLTFLRDPP